MLNYLIIVNVVAFFIYGIDKLLAIKHWYRISEFILLFFAFIGGILGAFGAMFLFRHKINSKKIKLYLLFFVIIWIILLFYL